MQIDKKAPVQAQAAMFIGAAPEEVWAVLSDVERWPEWNPDVRDVRMEGPLVPGAVFTWRGGRARITSTLREIRPASELGWSGRTGGIRAQHVYRLEPQGSGTRLSTAESWAGLWPRLLPGRLGRMLEQSLEKGLGYLDAEFGRRAIAAAAQELELARRQQGAEAAEAA